MSRPVAVVASIAAAISAAGCGDNMPPPPPRDAANTARCTPSAGRTLALRAVARGCATEGAPAEPHCTRGVATLATSPLGDPRLFVLELGGRIRVLDASRELLAAPFLDLSADAGGPVNGTGVSELGLLGLAFHPAYATNRQFFVFYTADNPDPLDVVHPYLDVLARYTASEADPNLADPASGEVLLSIPDPYANHNGGMIAFGPDGYLYVGTGDGGGVASVPADPFDNAQDPYALLGKFLRVDPDRSSPGRAYAIPPGNPYANGADGAPEVLIRGLRNPWRWSFDRETGDLWIGDVGEAAYEELDVLRAGQLAGTNLGWPVYEGPACHRAPCDEAGMTFPLDARDHATGWWSIIGGEVYRGRCMPDLVGTYLYTDTGSQHIYAAQLRPDGRLAVDPDRGPFIAAPSSLHGDADGELYATDIFGNVFAVEVMAQAP